MGKARRKLFVSAVISGIALVFGLPGLADLIGYAWGVTSTRISGTVPPGLVGFFSLVSLGIFGIITYLNWEIYLKGARKGKKGIITVVSGILVGAFIGIVILGIIRDIVSASG